MRQLITGGVIVALIVLTILTVRSCGSSKSAGAELIPAGSSLVASLDIRRLAGGLDMAAFTGGADLKTMLAGSDPRPQDPIYERIVANPLGSGIDFLQKIYYSLDIDEGNRRQYGAIIIVLDDAGTFEKEIIKPLGYRPIRKGRYSYAVLDRLTSVAWSDRHLILGVSTQIVDVEKELDRFFTTKKEASVASHASFRDIDGAGHSLALWINAGDFKNADDLLAGMGLPPVRPELLEGLFPTGYLDFHKGAMSGEFRFNSAGEPLRFSDVFLKSDRSDLYQYIPAEHNVLRLTTTFNLPAIVEGQLAEPKLREGAANLLAKVNLTLEDLYRALGGQVLVAMYRETEVLKPTLIVGVKIYNRQIADRIVSLFVESEYLAEDPGGDASYILPGVHQDSSAYYVSFPDGHPRLFFRDSMLLFTGNYNYKAALDRGGFARGELYPPSEIKSFNSHLLDLYYLNPAGAGSGSPVGSDVREFEIGFSQEKLGVHIGFKDEETHALQQLLRRR